MSGARGHHARVRLAGMAALSTFLALATPAHAQSAQPEVNLTQSPMQKVGSNLTDHGITLSSNYIGEFAANPAGGARQGAEFTGEFNLGADFDLDKIVGLPGGTIHVLFTARSGNDLAAKSINNSISVQQKYGDGQTYQLTIFSYEQKLFNDMLDFKVGRLDISEDFTGSPFYCYFQSFAVCSNPNLIEQDVFIGSSFYPLAVWGANARFNPVPDFYIKAGIYQNAPELNPHEGHGFDWSTSDSDGFQLPVEVGYAHTPLGAMTPDQYDVGIVIDRTHYLAPFYSATSPLRYGRSAVYIQAQKLLYQAAPASPRGLYGFGLAGFGISGRERTSNYSLEAGLLYQGPWPSRPLDTLGLVISDLHYNDNYINYLYAARVANGGIEHPRRNLIMMELNYAVQVTPWLIMMPNFQYIVNPDGLGALPYPNENEKNAVVLGLQFQIDAARLVGLSD